MKERFEYIDLMKGICILLVVLYHCEIPFILESKALTTFRMPLYYILSGIFFKKYGNLIDFGLKKTNKLMIPYLVTWVLYNVMLFAFSEYAGEVFVFKKYPRSIWFLMSLFQVGGMYYIVKYLNNIYLETLACLGISLYGYYLSLDDVWIAYNLCTSLTAISFYHYGSVMKTTGMLKALKQRTNVLLFLGCISLFVAITYFVPIVKLDMKFNRYPTNFPLTHAMAILGTLSVFYFSRIFNKVPVISYLGRYSLIVLCSHIIYLYILQNTLNIWYPSDYSSYFNFAIIMALMYPTIVFTIRFIPFLYAQKPFFKEDSSYYVLKGMKLATISLKYMKGK